MTTAPVNPLGQGADGSVAMSDFMELMHSFNEVTQQLEHTHDALRSQVASLQAELAEANERLRRSRSLAALGEMAAGIAHEIRNPLGSIGLNVGLLREDVADLPGSLVLCDKVAKAVSGLDSIVGDVLSFARDSKLVVQSCCPRELVSDALAANEALIGAGSIRIAVDVPDGLAVEVDRGLVVQGLTNVIRNACEALGSAGIEQAELTIVVDRLMARTTADGPRAEHVRFQVRDNGPGIPEHLRDRIFNPFFTTRETGTGLGLAIVHRIVDAHDGTLAIHDACPGARVELSFPIERTEPDDGDAGVSLLGAVQDRIDNHETQRRTP
ncbi:MAG: ATP-binding protein [Phycisphaerales bacterium]|nr:ATP-binding protein [Phycisphaerales bacterium]